MQVLSVPPVLLTPIAQKADGLKVRNSSFPSMSMGLGISSPLKQQQTTIVRTAKSDPYIDYDSAKSVFPAEACETVGGEACDGYIGPEVKPNAVNLAPRKETPEGIDREYVEYSNTEKTVFPGEACDDLGGEFCEADYQAGVYKEKGPSK